MPDLARLPWYDLVQLFLITAALAGLLLAWRWQMAADLVLTGSGLLTSVAALAAGFGPFTPLNYCLAPGLLLLANARGPKRQTLRGT